MLGIFKNQVLEYYQNKLLEEGKKKERKKYVKQTEENRVKEYPLSFRNPYNVLIMTQVWQLALLFTVGCLDVAHGNSVILLVFGFWLGLVFFFFSDETGRMSLLIFQPV